LGKKQTVQTPKAHSYWGEPRENSKRDSGLEKEKKKKEEGERRDRKEEARRPSVHAYEVEGRRGSKSLGKKERNLTII